MLNFVARCTGLGAEISEEKSSQGLEDDLQKIIGVCDTCFKDATDAEVSYPLHKLLNYSVEDPGCLSRMPYPDFF